MSEQPKEFEPSEKLVRRVTKAVFRSQVGYQKLGRFDERRPENRERVKKLLNEKPIFYENDPEAPTSIDIDSAVKELLPGAFFENPTAWIESQPAIDRRHS